MYAVIETGGKQYIVRENDILNVEKLDVEASKDVSFDAVLMVSDEKGEVKIGTPTLQGAKVLGELLGETKGKKVLIGKIKRRKNYRRKIGHRQTFSSVKIKSIEA
ncbi:MAG: 50S ribosomal protein L21 [Candidatus Coatesbacteria bacterium]|nr:MAG: 50S ribosomal protein L21 [Candidatus Coatesbacteria bacterium]HDM59152.1 50S ribosomal protein L21 [Bacillota bacterium]